MKAALIRLEDVGPGGHYETAESLRKLAVVADFLFANGVPFHVAVIPRFVDPMRGIDRSIGNPYDPDSVRFVRILHGLAARGASLGIHGYTHQYGNSVSGEGYEFSYAGCTSDCPPDDPEESLSEAVSFGRSYAYRRFSMAMAAFQSAGLTPGWFETPHYAASKVQRRILEACSWLVYENNPDAPHSRRVTARKSHSLLGRTFYVPTPLGYVAGTAVRKDVDRMLNDAGRYEDDELVSFFFHPFLEFPHIHLKDRDPAVYEDRTPLKELVGNILSLGRSFVTVKRLLYPRIFGIP